jgi:putative FmdB family regulatory protein
MPIYEYRCAKCSYQGEFLQRLSEAPLTKCPECGKKSLKKMVTAAGFQLKGTGWYATDFKNSGNKGKAKETPGDGASKESSAKESTAKESSAKDTSKSESGGSAAASPAGN